MSVLSSTGFAHLQRRALYWGGGGGQGCGSGHCSDHAGVVLQRGQQERLSLDELGLQQHLTKTCTHISIKDIQGLFLFHNTLTKKKEEKKSLFFMYNLGSFRCQRNTLTGT